MFQVCYQKHLLIHWAFLIAGVYATFLICCWEISPVEGLGIPSLSLNTKEKAKKCANVACMKPANPANCYIIPDTDAFFRQKKGGKAECCKSYRCFRKDGSGYTFHGLKGYGTETVNHNEYSHHKSVPKEIQNISKAKDTKVSVSSVATGNHDSNANAGDEIMMQDMMKEFGFHETPSDNDKSEENDDNGGKDTSTTTTKSIV